MQEPAGLYRGDVCRYFFLGFALTIAYTHTLLLGPPTGIEVRQELYASSSHELSRGQSLSKGNPCLTLEMSTMRRSLRLVS